MNKKIDNQFNEIFNGNLSYNEQIELLKDFKNNVLNSSNTGKKVHKTIYGEKVYIPKQYIGKYIKACKMLNQQNVIGNSKEEIEYLKLFKKLNSFKYIISTNNVLQNNYDQLINKLRNENNYSKRSSLIRNFFSDNIIIINFAKKNVSNIETIDDIKVYNRGLKKSKKEKFKLVFKGLVGTMGAILIMSSAAAYQSNTCSSTPKPTPIVQILETTVPTNTCVSKKVHKQKKIEYKNNTKKSIKHRYSKVQYKPPKKIKRFKKYIKPIKDKIKNSKIVLDFNSRFRIKKNSLIYSNMHDASNNQNYQKPYYEYNKIRKCVGFIVKYNNRLIPFIKKDKNVYKVNNCYLSKKETKKELKKFLSNGGIVDSIISGNDIENVEGFYKSKDIKVLTKQ